MATGAYLAEPRGPEHIKVSVFALQHRLRSDGLLVAKRGEEVSQEDLPVVPCSIHSSTVPGAPKRMTWQHIFLGAVHTL